MMFSKNRTVVGLDVGASSVKAVEFTVTRGVMSITGFGQVEVSGDTPEARRAAVEELARACGFRGRKVVTAISGKNVIVRYLTLPEMGDEEMRNAMAFEAAKYVPFPLEECVLDCQRLSGALDKAGPGNMTVVLVAARRTQVVEHLSQLEGTGVTADTVDLDVMALGNAFASALPEGDTTPNVSAVVDIGASKVSITIIADGTAWFTRELQSGAGKDMTSAVALRLGMGEADAEALKRDPSGREEEVADAVGSIIDDLANELQLSFDWFENQFERRIEKVLLSGGASRLPGLAQHFRTVLGREVTDFDPFAGISVDDGVDTELLTRSAPRFAVAAGLAARVKKD